MKFKKVNENKIVIMVTTTDLESLNIDVVNIRDNSVAYQKMFWEMMERAQNELDFDVTGSQLMVETTADKSGNITITITKSGTSRNPSNVIERIISEIMGNIHEDIMSSQGMPQGLNGFNPFEMGKIGAGTMGGVNGFLNDVETDFENEAICFDKIDDVIEFCKSLKDINNVASCLYNYNERYFLMLKRTKRNNKLVSNLLEAALEFNGIPNESYLLQSLLEERGNKIIKAKAIKTLAESF